MTPGRWVNSKNAVHCAMRPPGTEKFVHFPASDLHGFPVSDPKMGPTQKISFLIEIPILNFCDRDQSFEINCKKGFWRKGDLDFQEDD